VNRDLASQKKISDMAQIAGIRSMDVKSGKAKGNGILEVYNEAGLRFSVLPDQCLDIFDLHFRGINIGFPSKTGLQSNAFFNALGAEFSYYWRAGMLYTCGLANAGPPCEDGGVWRTEHGRIGMTPAENVCAKAFWEGERYRLRISGEMREGMICGYDMKLVRQIETERNAKEIRITDTVINQRPVSEEFMLLYHVNFGYPLLDEGVRLVKGKGGVSPRTGRAAEGIKEWNRVSGPEDVYEEQCFFHENTADDAGFAYFGIINDKLGLGAYIKYSLATLPVVVEWKNLQAHDYVVALEPSNSYIMGRHSERENGTLPKLEGYGEAEHTVCVGFLEGEEIAAFEGRIKAL